MLANPLDGFTGAAEMNHWISVKERLPEDDGQMVIVCNTNGWMRYQRALYYPRDNLFVHYDPQYYDKLTLDVTHWMPLPEPPK